MQQKLQDSIALHHRLFTEARQGRTQQKLQDSIALYHRLYTEEQPGRTPKSNSKRMRSITRVIQSACTVSSEGIQAFFEGTAKTKSARVFFEQQFETTPHRVYLSSASLSAALRTEKQRMEHTTTTTWSQKKYQSPAAGLLILLLSPAFFFTDQACATQSAPMPTMLSSKQIAFMQSLSVVPLPETAMSVKGVVNKQTNELFVVNIPVPPSMLLDGGKVAFASKPEDIYPYGDGKVKPCDSDETATTAQNIAFIPVIMEHDVEADATLASTNNIQSDFKCTYDYPAQSFVRCEDRIMGEMYTAKYSISTARNIEFVAVLAMVPSCASAKAFTDTVRQGNKMEMGVMIGLIVGVVVLVMLLAYCVFRCDRARLNRNDAERKVEQTVKPVEKTPVTVPPQNEQQVAVNPVMSLFAVTDVHSFLSSAVARHSSSSYSRVPTTQP